MAKMYAINREFLPYLHTKDIPDLIRLEVNEYSRREKLDILPKPNLFPYAKVSFESIEEAISQKDWRKTAAKMAAFLKQQGPVQFTRRLLLLGSGYMDRSLGHSVSCTAFILLEMIKRKDQDSWPVLALLSDYFCKGGFHKTPHLKKSGMTSKGKDYFRMLDNAIDGTGIVELHHTITLYAIERVHHVFMDNEYEHMLTMCADFIGENKAGLPFIDLSQGEIFKDFSGFFYLFSRLETLPVVRSILGLIGSETNRKKLGRYLIKGVSQLYQGDYDPHYLTGLGSALWVMERFHDQPTIVAGAMFQYLDFFFSGMAQ